MVSGGPFRRTRKDLCVTGPRDPRGVSGRTSGRGRRYTQTSGDTTRRRESFGSLRSDTTPLRVRRCQEPHARGFTPVSTLSPPNRRVRRGCGTSPPGVPRPVVVFRKRLPGPPPVDYRPGHDRGVRGRIPPVVSSTGVFSTVVETSGRSLVRESPLRPGGHDVSPPGST